MKEPTQSTIPNLITTDGESFDIPEGGSLGLLALGYVGVMLWREKRREIQNKKLKNQPRYIIANEKT